jgi:hypothetical protein
MENHFTQKTPKPQSEEGVPSCRNRHFSLDSGMTRLLTLRHFLFLGHHRFRAIAEPAWASLAGVRSSAGGSAAAQYQDFPKLWEAWRGVVGILTVSGHGDRLQTPQFVTFNGQLGAMMDASSIPYAMRTYFDVKTLEAKQGVVRNDEANLAVRLLHTARLHHKDRGTFSSFSLLSWDGKTVSSDVYAEIARIAIPENKMETNGEIKELERKTISEKGLVWSADGMLIVFFKGVRIAVDTEYRGEAGVPILRKIPYVSRLFSNTGIARGSEEQIMYGILTIRMLAPNEVPQTAVAPAAIRR